MQASEVNRLFGVSKSLGVEGARSSLHFKEADLAEVVGLAVEDLVEVVLADRGRVIVHCDVLLTGSWGKALLGFFSYTMSGESSPGSSFLPSTISTLGDLLKSGVLSLLDVWLDCTLAGRPRGRSLTIVGFTILPSWFFYKDNNHEKFDICYICYGKVSRTYFRRGQRSSFDGAEVAVQLGINAVVAFLTWTPLVPLELFFQQRILLAW